ncbi:MAG: glycosyltransferase family 39 protein [Zoogloea sp.]|nr:glycosyltransferase family 39 protein [Zoogloea sp.]
MLVKKLHLLLPVYAAIVVCFCLTFGGGVLALTVEPDEVWILMSTMKAFGIPLPPTSALDNPVTTTGGLHFVLHGLMALLWGGDLLVHRLASISVTLILLGLVFNLIERRIKDRVLAAAGTALFAAAPGFLLQASLATAEIIATTVFLLAALFWVRFGSRSPGMAILGGVLFGLACATRMTCLSMLPAILVWSVLAHRGWVARLVHPVLAVAVAVLVFVGCVAVYFAAFGDAPWSEFLAAAGLVHRRQPPVFGNHVAAELHGRGGRDHPGAVHRGAGGLVHKPAAGRGGRPGDRRVVRFSVAGGGSGMVRLGA